MWYYETFFIDIGNKHKHIVSFEKKLKKKLFFSSSLKKAIYSAQNGTIFCHHVPNHVGVCRFGLHFPNFLPGIKNTPLLSLCEQFIVYHLIFPCCHSVEGDIKFWDPRLTSSVKTISNTVTGLTSFDVHQQADLIAWYVPLSFILLLFLNNKAFSSHLLGCFYKSSIW